MARLYTNKIAMQQSDLLVGATANMAACLSPYSGFEMSQILLGSLLLLIEA